MKIRQGCAIFVHERGEHRATRIEHWQWRGGGVAVTPLAITANSYRKVVRRESGYTVGISRPQPNEDCAIDNSPCP